MLSWLIITPCEQSNTKEMNHTSPVHHKLTSLEPLASSPGSTLCVCVIIASDMGSKVITHKNYTRAEGEPGDEAMEPLDC